MPKNAARSDDPGDEGERAAIRSFRSDLEALVVLAANSADGSLTPDQRRWIGADAHAIANRILGLYEAAVLLPGHLHKQHSSDGAKA